MFRLRADEDVHVDVVTGTRLRVRRLSKGIERWEHTLDLSELYADRFTAPNAHVIDGWFGAAGELRLIVHAREPNGPLLPPRELTYAADGPRLERSRPGAARRSLASKPLRSHDWGGTTLQLVQELDDHVLAILATEVARRLGWSIADLPDIGYRWFERSEIGHLPPPDNLSPCPTCGDQPPWGAEHVRGMNPVSVDREHGQSKRIVECHACLAIWEVDEVIEQGTMKQLWRWKHSGARASAARPVQRRTPVRIEPAPMRIVVPEPPPAPEPKPVHGIPGSKNELVAAQPPLVAPPAWPTGAPPLDTVRAELARHTELTFAGDSRVVHGESADAVTLEALMPMLAFKGDGSLTGNHLYWVRLGPNLLRVIAETPEHVLAIAHPELGAELGFHVLQPERRVTVRWFARTAVERAATTTVPPGTRSKLPAPVIDDGTVRIAGVARRLRPVDDDGARYTFHEDLEDYDWDLEGLGFASETEWVKIDHLTDVPHYHYRFTLAKTDPRIWDHALQRRLRERGQWVTLDGAPTVVEIETPDAFVLRGSPEVIAKTDPRLGGFAGLADWGGWQLRIVEEAHGGALVIMRPEVARMWPSFEIAGEIGYGWTTTVNRATPRPLLLDPAMIASLAPHVELYVAPLARSFRVVEETATEIELAEGQRFKKPDPRLLGPLRWARTMRQVVRVAAERGAYALVVATSPLGHELDLTRVQPREGIELYCGWLPERELTTLEVARVEDRAAGGDDLALVAGHDRVDLHQLGSLEVAGETAETLEVVHDGQRRRVLKVDDRITGPFAKRARVGAAILRVVYERGGKRLLVAHRGLGDGLGFTPAGALGYRWVDDREAPIVPAVERPLPEAELAGFEPITLVRDDGPRALEVEREREDAFDLAGGERVEKLDPRLGGFVRMVKHEGRLVRVAVERENSLLLVVDQTFAAAGDIAGPGIGWRWVPAHHASPPDATHGMLYRHLRVFLAGRDDPQFVTDETPEAFTLAHGSIAKTDRSLTGPYRRMVVLRGHLVRVAEELQGWFLVIAAGRLAHQLQLAPWRHEGHELGYAWKTAAELDAV